MVYFTNLTGLFLDLAVNNHSVNDTIAEPWKSLFTWSKEGIFKEEIIALLTDNF